MLLQWPAFSWTWEELNDKLLDGGVPGVRYSETSSMFPYYTANQTLTVPAPPTAAAMPADDFFEAIEVWRGSFALARLCIFRLNCGDAFAFLRLYRLFSVYSTFSSIRRGTIRRPAMPSVWMTGNVAICTSASP